MLKSALSVWFSISNLWEELKPSGGARQWSAGAKEQNFSG
jgi:hypothetical protein